MITVSNGRMLVETSTLTAVLEKGHLTSLKSKATGEEFIEHFDPGARPALQLLYPNGETLPIDESRFGRITCRRVSDSRAEFVFHGWEGDGLLAVGIDPHTGDLMLEPSAYSSRPGVRACRWDMCGLRRGLQLVAPLFQGVKLDLHDPLIAHSRWAWPMQWEAALAILQGPAGGLWVHAEDDRYRYKALVVDADPESRALAFDTEAYGPTDANLSAGGLCWRINVYQGDWRVPAARYRDWLWNAYGLAEQEAARPAWVRDIRLAISWCPGEMEILDALAARVDPTRVLLHYPNWRTDPYDQNYPAFVPSEQAKSFVAKGRQMGFHIMPHFNAVDMDPTHPVYALVRDFQYRDIESKRLHGWSWHAGGVIGIPESNDARTRHRDLNVMVKIHPGLAMWRAVLGESIQKAADLLSLEAAFIDVTLTQGNLHNCLVEGMTSTEGMKRLIAHVAGLGAGLVVGGEGLNEITMQGLSFAQAHLFQSWQSNAEGLERTGGCDLNNFMFGRLCRQIGYSGLSGRNEAEQLRMRIHEEHGAIPTITIHSARDITNPNRAVEAVLKKAAA